MSFDANEIINLYKDQYGYVSDIESVKSLFKQDKTLTKKEKNEILLKILKWNLQIDKENKEKLKDYNHKEKEINLEIKENEKNLENDKKESEILDVKSYINSIRACDDDDFLTEVLPSIYDNNYESIIGAILLSLFSEITFANEMLLEDKSEENRNYIESIIKRNKEIIEIIKQYNLEEEKEITQETNNKENNKLIFLKKNNSSLYIDDDIDSIAIEEDVLPILNDIITGNFTREKRFHNNNELKGISAIRRRDTRIIFTRLNNDTILILGILVKRFQNPQTYRDMLKARNKEYKLQKEALKINSQNEEFLKSNSNIQEETIKKLKLRKKTFKED